MAFSAPILLIAFLVVARLIISAEDVLENYVIPILQWLMSFRMNMSFESARSGEREVDGDTHIHTK